MSCSLQQQKYSFLKIVSLVLLFNTRFRTVRKAFMEETTLLGTNFVRNLRFYFSVSILSNSLTKHSFSVGGELSAPRSTFKPPSPASFQPIRGEEVQRWGAPLDTV